jgi:hypothetical protein
MKAVSLVAAGGGGCRLAVVRPTVRGWIERERETPLPDRHDASGVMALAGMVGGSVERRGKSGGN